MWWREIMTSNKKRTKLLFLRGTLVLFYEITTLMLYISGGYIS